MHIMLTRAVCGKLAVDAQDLPILAATQRASNQAAIWDAQVCWDEQLTNPTTAHHRGYGETRAASAWGSVGHLCQDEGGRGHQGGESQAA